jgi:hypothetical protein
MTPCDCHSRWIQRPLRPFVGTSAIQPTSVPDMAQVTDGLPSPVRRLQLHCGCASETLYRCALQAVSQAAAHSSSVIRNTIGSLEVRSRRGCCNVENRFQYLPRSRGLRADRCRANRIGGPFPERWFESRSAQHRGYRDGDDTVHRGGGPDGCSGNQGSRATAEGRARPAVTVPARAGRSPGPATSKPGPKFPSSCRRRPVRSSSQ